MKFENEALGYTVVIMVAQTTVTAMASSENLTAGLCVGAASILANLIVLAFVRIEIARQHLDDSVMGQATPLEIGTAYHEAFAADPTANYRTLRQRAIRALAAKRRKAIA